VIVPGEGRLAGKGVVPAIGDIETQIVPHSMADELAGLVERLRLPPLPGPDGRLRTRKSS